jgi:hypothetical protein
MDGRTGAEIARDQQDLITRRQLRAAGVTRDQLRWRLGRTWRLVLPSVVDVAGGSLAGGRRLLAAALEAGAGSVLTGHHACAWHGLGSARGNRAVQLLVPANRASRDAGFVTIRRTTRPDLRPLRRGLLVVARPERAVADAARSALSGDEATALVIEATQRGLVTIEALEHELAAGPNRSSALLRAALRTARAGAWSAPEADLLRLCATSTVLPHAFPNPELWLPDGGRLLSPDVWFDDVGLAIMVHSKAHHARDADWEGTVEADGRLAEAGLIVVAFTPRSISTAPQRVLRRIEATYRESLRSGRRRPDVQLVPRGYGLLA